MLLSSPVSAQEDAFSEGFIEHDYQFFSPVQFDFDNQPVNRKSGYFFTYDKLSWAITGERAVIGDQSVNVQSENYLPVTNLSQGTPPASYQVVNGVQDAPPNADFAWGDRYEFGIQHEGHSWGVSILDGPEVNTHETYGFQELVIPGTLPFITRSTTAFSPDTVFDSDNLDPGLAVLLFPSGPTDASTTINGFGSVPVNFRTPPGYLLGLRDYWLGQGGGPNVAGPGRRILATAVTTTIVDGVVQAVQIGTAAIGDGADMLLADDLNGNGLVFLFDDLNGNGEVDPGEPIGVDYGDLNNFNIFFDTLAVRNTTRADGVELMHTIDVKNRHKMTKHQNSHVKIGAGVRYFRLQDEFSWEGRGGVLGLTRIGTDVQNSIFGPQVRLQWHTQRGRWGMAVDGRFVWGFNSQDLDMDAIIGQDLLPGGLNSPVNARPTATRSGRHDETFTPMGELRADATYQITSSIAARLGYTAMFIDNISRGSQVVDYVLPNPGLLKGGEQDIFINGVNFGVDVVY